MEKLGCCGLLFASGVGENNESECAENGTMHITDGNRRLKQCFVVLLPIAKPTVSKTQGRWSNHAQR